MTRTLLLALLLTVGSAAAASTEVQNVRLWSGPEGTRVVLDLSRPAEHSLFTLQGPDRVVVDIRGATLAGSLPQASGSVRALRSARQPDGALRVVLDLASSAQPRSFLLPPNETYGHRLVIDLAPREQAARPVKRQPAPQGRGRDLVIAVDPGHGGEDPGAIGRGGTREKDVVLAIGRELARRIDAEPGMRAVLIRDGDYFIPLRGRIERARAHQADLFVSIHADAYHNQSARGATVYVLSQRGASDEVARRVAERENASDLIGGVTLADKDDMLASVLLDLSQNASLSVGAAVGQSMIREMGHVTRMRRDQVQRAPFVVLKSPDIPSLLVETAYISNPDEERGLSDRAHQRRLADAMLVGIRNYFHENPPPDTYIARMRSEGLTEPARYVVARGDTLSAIASRHNVPLTVLRNHNNLNGDRIRVGQVLSIPGSSGG
ncbi:MAG: N-acetylmuramoyl-L-alanine amidase [Gammaproteobacteria bacterium]|nr:N-acetylmuramoyl-L-alanine amidase [Gammaproteobacteria bacterium]